MGHRSNSPITGAAQPDVVSAAQLDPSAQRAHRRRRTIDGIQVVIRRAEDGRMKEVGGCVEADDDYGSVVFCAEASSLRCSTCVFPRVLGRVV